MEITVEAQEVRRNYKRQYRLKNRDRINASHREWCARNRDKVQQYNREYWERKAERQRILELHG